MFIRRMLGLRVGWRVACGCFGRKGESRSAAGVGALVASFDLDGRCM